MSISKRILGLIIGPCVALLIVIGATSSSGHAVASEPALLPTPSADTLAACGKCGDNYCNPRCGETATSCPRDCGGGGGTASVAAACGKCGDGYCNPRCGETATSCPRDCGVKAAFADRDDCSL